MFLCGHKGGRLVSKGTSLHALARSCGPLSCTCFDPPDDTDNQTCLTSAFPRVTGSDPSHWQGRKETLWQISYVRSGRLEHPRNYAGEKADRHQAQQARLAAPTAGFDPFL